MFPPKVATVKTHQTAAAEDRFSRAAHPDFVPGRIVNGTFYPLDTDTDFQTFQDKLAGSRNNQKTAEQPEEEGEEYDELDSYYDDLFGF